MREKDRDGRISTFLKRSSTLRWGDINAFQALINVFQRLVDGDQKVINVQIGVSQR
jgi:hypothetical protein